MTSSSNPEIAELWEKVEQLDKEIAEVRASINRLNKIVRANIRQAVWQSIVLFISVCLAVAGGLAYQTSVLNKRFAQMEKDWKESDRRFAERSKLSEENLKTYLEQSEKNRTTPSDNLKPKVRVPRK
jgi:DNA repair exonuclease SbcCD ATPase subunit